MRSVLRLLALVPLLLIGVSWAAPGDGKLALETDRQKADFLFSIQEAVPGLFDDAMAYDVDLFEVMDKQQELVGELEEVDGFTQTSRSRVLHELNIQPQKTALLTTKQIDPVAIARWKQFISGSLELLPEKNAQAALLASLDRALNNLSRIEPGAFSTGLIQLLPSEERKALFAMPMDRRIEELARQLPEDAVNLLDRGFKASIYGIEDKVFTRAEALAVLKKANEWEKEARALAQLQLVLQDQSGEIPATARARHLRLEDLGESALDLISDPQVFEERFKALKQKFAHPEQLKKPLDLLERGIKLQAKEVSGAQIEIKQAPGKPIRLVEQPPRVAVFRGCTGSDCSTSYSFGYPNSPSEKVFFVYDAESPAPKGYVSLTEVRIKSGTKLERALFVHTINGKRISAADTQNILAALQEKRASLGAAHLLVPTASDLAGYVNFSEISGAVTDFAKQGVQVPIQFSDGKYRQVIDRYSEMSYDKFTTEKSGRRIPPAEGSTGLKIEISLAPKPPLPRPASKGEALLFALDLSEGKLSKQVPRLLEAYDIKSIELKALKETLENSRRAPLAEYYAQAERAFTKAGIANAEGLRVKRPQLFNAGHLLAPDAFSAANIDASSAQVALFARTANPHIEAGRQIQSHAAELAKTPPIRALAARASQLPHVDIYLAKRLVKLVPDPSIWDASMPELIQRFKTEPYQAGYANDLNLLLHEIAPGNEKLEAFLAEALLGASDVNRERAASLASRMKVKTPRLEAARIAAFSIPGLSQRHIGAWLSNLSELLPREVHAQVLDALYAKDAIKHMTKDVHADVEMKLLDSGSRDPRLKHFVINSLPLPAHEYASPAALRYMSLFLDDPEVQRIAAHYWVKNGIKREFAKGVTDRKWDWAREFLEFNEKHRPPAVAAALQSFFKWPSKDIRLKAAQELFQTNPGHGAAIELLLREGESTHFWTLAQGEIWHPKVTRTLIARLGAPKDHAERRRIIELLINRARNNPQLLQDIRSAMDSAAPAHPQRLGGVEALVALEDAGIDPAGGSSCIANGLTQLRIHRRVSPTR